MPLISIIIPVYSAEKYLRRCLECVFNQKYKEWELILVNDGSTDSSKDILERELPLMCLDLSINNRITVIHQTNAGPSVARNKGLQEAKGEYVCFIDADDWFDNDLLQTYANAIVDKAWDIVFQGFIREKEDGTIASIPFAANLDTDRQDKDDIICQLYKGHVYGWSWCKMFRREIIERNAIMFDENLRLWEDELFTSHFLRYATSVKTLDCRHYHYVQYPMSLMNTNNTYLKRLELSEIMNDALYPIANQELLHYINDNYNKNLKFSMLMALMNKPDHQCTEGKKKELISKYFHRCKDFPEIKNYNALSNKVSYLIAESILMMRSPKLIMLTLSKLG